MDVCVRAHVKLALEHERALNKLRKDEILDFCFTRTILTHAHIPLKLSRFQVTA